MQDTVEYDDLFDSVDRERVTERVAEATLPPRVATLTDLYDEHIGLRDPTLWRFFYASMEPVRLSCVPESHHQTVRELKTLGAIFVTVVDDIADRVGQPEHLRRARRITGHRADAAAPDLAAADDPAARHLAYAQRVWAEIERSLDAAPRREAFRPILDFDVETVIHAMKYEMLVAENPGLTNLAEGLGLGAHGFMHYLNADIDLLYSPAFERRDLGPLRRIVWEGQQLHRLLNWAITWKREVYEGDISAGVFALALRDGVLDPDDLRRLRDGVADPESLRECIEAQDFEQRLLARWNRQFEDALDAATAIETASVDLAEYVLGVRTVCQNSLATKEGLW